MASGLSDKQFLPSSCSSVGSTRQKEKEGPRVVFGVPKPGKKQKFMDVSKHYYVDDGIGSRHNNNQPPPPPRTTTTTSRRPHDSVKFTRYLIPQAPSGGMKNNISSKEKQAAAAMQKPPRKPPVPSLRTLASSKSSTTNKTTTTTDSVSDDDNKSHQLNQMELDAPIPADLAIPAAEPVKKVSTSSTRSERVNKRKFVSPAAAVRKEEKSVSEHVEPSRRSNRKIQPTSRLLEGLQSSMTISKIPAASNFTQRSHTKATAPKGNTDSNA